MEASLHNDYRQHPILSDEGLEQYRAYLGRLEAMIAEQEDLVGQARAAGEDAHLARERTRLWRLLTKRQGVLDAIAAYDRQRTEQQHASGNDTSQARARAGSDAAAGLEGASSIPPE
jgi:hypothetical protein